MNRLLKHGSSCLLLAITAAALAQSQGAAQAQAGLGGLLPPITLTDRGLVKGENTDYGRAFRGIPYAAPPVGNLRWKAPQRPKPWLNVLDATRFKSSCPQNPGPFGLASTNEDCLYLNVYTPPVTRLLPKHPVMVWLHPGAFQVGDSGAQVPSDLVRRGVVVVTLNYRLGVLGWLAHPALTGESPDATSGNYGLQDQQLALRWVRNNIIAFGGDPRNVTIFGESAGGVSVHTHMISPQSAGLFHRGIVQSGAYAMTFPTLATAEQQGVAFATQVGCTNQDAACLRNLSVSAILAAQSPLPNAYMPRKDGELVPLSPTEAFASGAFHHVPVIEGSTHDEFSLFVASTFLLRGIPVTPANYASLIAVLLGLTPEQAAVALPAIVAQYPTSAYPSASVALTAVATDAVFACNSLLAMTLLAARVPTWGYEFDDPNAPMGALPPPPIEPTFPYGAYHGSELQYLFDVRRTIPAPPLDADQEVLSAAMQSYWTEFAANGNPNATDTPLWPLHIPLIVPTTVPTSKIQLLAPPDPGPYLTAQFAADHKCSFWAALAAAPPAQ
jgi:para-nitrobenzyl esterase